VGFREALRSGNLASKKPTVPETGFRELSL
jgi:hypothetical protein